MIKLNRAQPGQEYQYPIIALGFTLQEHPSLRKYDVLSVVHFSSFSIEGYGGNNYMETLPSAISRLDFVIDRKQVLGLIVFQATSQTEYE